EPHTVSVAILAEEALAQHRVVRWYEFLRGSWCDALRDDDAPVVFSIARGGFVLVEYASAVVA
ncbi:MAG TPA: hypothetical protein VE591_14410, partial [Candidatus Acidoferrum sp.]|nr:hypothetical protein [Candidatus Acidoferrum sp.]